MMLIGAVLALLWGVIFGFGYLGSRDPRELDRRLQAICRACT